jgi:hypothetical protein
MQWRAVILIQASFAASSSGRLAVAHTSPLPEEAWMNFYTQHHKHSCGIDLPARAMYVGIVEGAGTKLIPKN